MFCSKFGGCLDFRPRQAGPEFLEEGAAVARRHQWIGCLNRELGGEELWMRWAGLHVTGKKYLISVPGSLPTGARLSLTSAITRNKQMR